MNLCDCHLVTNQHKNPPFPFYLGANVPFLIVAPAARIVNGVFYFGSREVSHQTARSMESFELPQSASSPVLR